MIKIFLIAVCGSYILTGCASMVTGDEFEVSVNSIPQKANCILENDEGRYIASDTPTTVTVNKSCSPMQVSCSLEGYKDATEVIAPGNSKVAWVNAGLLFAGGYGYMLDRDTGAACKYSNQITVKFKK